MSAYLVSLACVIGINMILALSLNIITGFCGQISLGHAAFYGIGAYAAALLAKAGAPVAACLLAGTVVAGAIGTLVGLTALRVRHDFLAITTMGVGFIFLGVVRKQSWLCGELGIAGLPDAGFDPPPYALLVLTMPPAVVPLTLWANPS